MLRWQTHRKWWVYALSDPLEPDHIRYVGKTEKSPAQRLGEHIRDSIRYNRSPEVPRNRWVKKIHLEGRVPIQIILESGLGIGPADWVISETCWIAYYRLMGHRLINITAGGEGSSGYCPTEETRAKISNANLGKKRREGSGKNISDGLKASYARMSDEERSRRRRAISLSAHKIHTPAAIEKRRQSAIGKSPSEKTKKLLANRHKGEKRPQHVVARMKEFHRGRQFTPTLTDSQVREIRERRLSEHISMAELGKAYGVSITVIYNLLHGHSYKRVQKNPEDTPSRRIIPQAKSPSGPLNSNIWTKLTQKQAIEIRRLRKVEGLTLKAIALRYDVTAQTISAIVKGRTYSGSPHKHNTRTKLTFAIAQEIRQRFADGKTQQVELAREYGVTAMSIRSILIGKSYNENNAGRYS